MHVQFTVKVDIFSAYPLVCDVPDVPFVLVLFEKVIHLLQATASLLKELVRCGGERTPVLTVSGTKAHTMGIQHSVMTIQMR